MTAIHKPLNRRAYGSIGHLPGSRRGPGDHGVNDGMARICTERLLNINQRVIVQEKLDGSCVAVALIDGKLVPMGRSGWPAVSSPYPQHRMFHDWVFSYPDRFYRVLLPGERIVGEWLAQAHGTRYTLRHDPFVPFDIIAADSEFPDGQRRLCFDEFNRRVGRLFQTPFVISSHLPIAVDSALDIVDAENFHNAIDPIEGVVYRVETGGQVDFLAKHVRPHKIDGCFLPILTHEKPIWNWRPAA